MGKRKSVTIGYWYYFGIHMGICRGPVNSLVEIRVGDRTAWQGNQVGLGSIFIDKPALFGGEKKEGGIQGHFITMPGDSDQVAPPSLVNMLGGGTIPAYRGMFTAFYDGTVTAINPYPKKWEFRVRRTTAGWTNDAPWYPSKATILLSGNQIHAMNPAHIIYECLTNREWGRGYDPSVMDVASFQNAADRLHEEEFGLCLAWKRKDDISQFVQLVIDYIGAALFTDRLTGLIKLKLIRNDYVASALPIYTTDNGILEIREATVAASTGVVNQVEVKYNDPITQEDRTVKVHNLAAIQGAGGAFNSVTHDYPGLPTSELALRVAQRELMMASYPLRRFKLTFDRSAWRINPADVIRIRNPERNIEDIVLRVGMVEDGTLTSGQITVTAMQDVFAMPLTSFSGYEPPSWEGPDLDPKLKRFRVFEAPYILLNRFFTPGEFNAITDEAGYVTAVVEKPTPLSTGFDLNVDPEGTP